MMDHFFDFAGHHPFLTLFLAIIAASAFGAPFRYAFLAWNRTLRSRNIAARGWPPGHLDADGDFMKERDE